MWFACGLPFAQAASPAQARRGQSILNCPDGVLSMGWNSKEELVGDSDGGNPIDPMYEMLTVIDNGLEQC